jgi:hypothetical protein
VSVSELLTPDDLGQHVLTIVLVNSSFDLMLLSSLAWKILIDIDYSEIFMQLVFYS